MTDDLLAQHLQACRGRTLKSVKTINGVIWLDFEDSGLGTKIAFSVKGNSFVSSSTQPIKKVKTAQRVPLQEKESGLAPIKKKKAKKSGQATTTI